MSEQSIDTGHRKNGKFAPGHKFSVGNRGNYHPRTLRSQIVDETSIDTVRALMGKLYSQAMTEGNTSSARLWLEYVLGRAPASLTVSGPGGMPLVTNVILPVIMRALESHPEAKQEITAALAQLQLESPDDSTSPPDPK